MKKPLTLSILLTIYILTNSQSNNNFYLQLADAAKAIVDPTIIYDPAYTRMTYPNGDVDKGKGVCTDVVIRAYRRLGIDLQKELHKDIKANFNKYPSKKTEDLNTLIRTLTTDEFLICKYSLAEREKF